MIGINIIRIKYLLCFIVFFIIKNIYASEELIKAVKNGDEHKVAQLIKSNVNLNEVNNLGQSALMWAANRENLTIAKMLVEAGANPHLISRRGFNALSLAILRENNELSTYLIENGGDLKKTLSEMMITLNDRYSTQSFIKNNFNFNFDEEYSNAIFEIISNFAIHRKCRDVKIRWQKKECMKLANVFNSNQDPDSISHMFSSLSLNSRNKNHNDFWDTRDVFRLSFYQMFVNIKLNQECDINQFQTYHKQHFLSACQKFVEQFSKKVEDLIKSIPDIHNLSKEQINFLRQEVPEIETANQSMTFLLNSFIFLIQNPYRNPAITCEKSLLNHGYISRKMDHQYNNENNFQLSSSKKLIKYYYNDEDRKKFKIKIHNGFIYNQLKDRPLNRSGMLYVMDTYGEIYVGNPMKHSSFLAGAPVTAAGEISINKGKIISIDRNSGHYTPKKEHLMQFLSVLIAKGYKFDSDVSID